MKNITFTLKNMCNYNIKQIRRIINEQRNDENTSRKSYIFMFLLS